MKTLWGSPGGMPNSSNCKPRVNAKWAASGT
jgi:hypothetical protein